MGVVRHSEALTADSGASPDSEFDRRLWMRIAELVPNYARASVERLPWDVQAYFVTRLFEWETANGGPDAFLYAAPQLLALVAPAYRHLGLDTVADSFTRFATAEPTRRILADPKRSLTDAESSTLRRLFNEIGNHDAERIAFVLANPESFSF